MESTDNVAGDGGARVGFDRDGRGLVGWGGEGERGEGTLLVDIVVLLVK